MKRDDIADRNTTCRPVIPREGCVDSWMTRWYITGIGLIGGLFIDTISASTRCYTDVLRCIARAANNKPARFMRQPRPHRRGFFFGPR